MYSDVHFLNAPSITWAVQNNNTSSNASSKTVVRARVMRSRMRGEYMCGKICASKAVVCVCDLILVNFLTSNPAPAPMLQTGVWSLFSRRFLCGICAEFCAEFCAECVHQKRWCVCDLILVIFWLLTPRRLLCSKLGFEVSFPRVHGCHVSRSYWSMSRAFSEPSHACHDLIGPPWSNVTPLKSVVQWERHNLRQSYVILGNLT
jgi:hypothetical protein